MDQGTDCWMDRWMGGMGWMYVWMDGWMGGRMDGWMIEWIEGWAV